MTSPQFDAEPHQVRPGVGNALDAVGAAAMKRGGRRLAAVALTVLLLVSWRHVYCVTCAGYTYLWWLRPSVEWALPDDVGADEQANLPVPAIIHQTWQTNQVPDKWKEAQQSCIDMHPDYEYRLWTDDDGLQLIKDHYAWFLPTYQAYPYTIQRVDAVRYFILHRHGGIYIDLDIGCLKRLDFMRRANFTLPATYPIGLSNDIMAARRHDIFLSNAITQLARWNRWLVTKYVQVMFSTGPMFLTVQFALAPAWLRRGVEVVPKPTYGKYDLSGPAALYHLHGSSWHADDAAFMFWLDRHRGTLGLMAAAAALAVVAAVGTMRGQRRRRRESMEADAFDALGKQI